MANNDTFVIWLLAFDIPWSLVGHWELVIPQEADMSDLIAPHGGLTEPVNRTRDDVGTHAKKVALSDADLSSLYRIGDGGLSPLTGPMTREEWDRVLDEEVIVRDGQKYAWTIPIAFPVDEATAKGLKTGETVSLVNAKGEVVGSLDVKDVYPWNKTKYLKVVYQTDRTDHPGGHMTLKDERTYLVGGDVWVQPPLKHAEYVPLVLTPR